MGQLWTRRSNGWVSAGSQRTSRRWGIGENAPEVRAEICSGMEWCGLALDPERNTKAVGEEARISADGAPVEVYVIPVDEAAIIARDTVDCLLRRNHTRVPSRGGQETRTGQRRA